MTRSTELNRVAEEYVRLVLAVGQHDADYVDAFYGPEEWAAGAKNSPRTLDSLKDAGRSLQAEIGRIEVSADEEIVRLRHQYVSKQLDALLARVNVLSGTKLSFDEEAKAFYDTVPPIFPEEHFQKLLKELESLVPGPGSLSVRVEEFRRRFVIPPDRLDAVFTAAIDECRARTRKHIPLPPNETFNVEYVKNKSWSGYNWFKGNCYSLIQVNTDLPIFLERAVDLAAHEGYPGHHIYNSLLETALVRARGWVEFSVYALFSPQSLIAEGTANFGIEVAFPGTERLAFERDVLFPIIGCDPAGAAPYAQLQALTAKLSYAGNEAARRYLDGAFTRDQAAEWLVTYALMSPERAQQRTRFFDQYRSYVINYNLGQDLVKAYIEARGGTADAPDRRWKEFAALLSSPRLPSGIRL